MYRAWRMKQIQGLVSNTYIEPWWEIVPLFASELGGLIFVSSFLNELQNLICISWAEWIRGEECITICWMKHWNIFRIMFLDWVRQRECIIWAEWIKRTDFVSSSYSESNIPSSIKIYEWGRGMEMYQHHRNETSERTSYHVPGLSYKKWLYHLELMN